MKGHDYLPAKAERDRLRSHRDAFVFGVFSPDRQTILSLLDWADAQEAETREAMKFGDTKDARIRLAHMAANLGDSDDETDSEASALLSALLSGGAVLAGGQPAPVLEAMRAYVAQCERDNANQKGSAGDEATAAEAALIAARDMLEIAEHGAAQAPERVVVGYQVRWTSRNGEESASWRLNEYSDARLCAYRWACDLLCCASRGASNVRIRKLTRPVRQPGDGGAK